MWWDRCHLFDFSLRIAYSSRASQGALFFRVIPSVVEGYRKNKVTRSGIRNQGAKARVQIPKLSFLAQPLDSARGKNFKEIFMAKKSMIIKANRKPKFSSRTVRRCFKCGRPRAFMRDFNLCRICFREEALEGNIPGIKKSSW